jgi:two-component system LytT family response regulator
MKAILVDDEPLARYELRRLLRAHPEVEIVGEAEDGEQTLRLLATVTPDVLFLDIQMPGLSGFDLLDHLGGNVPEVIFTTAYEQHALRAFEVNALDYLLKPIAPDRLAVALRRLGLRRPLAPVSQIFVRDGDRCWIVPLADIYLLESEGNYTRLYFGADRPLLRRSLNALERQLAPQTFFRANRRQMLNLLAIAKTQLTETGRLVVTLQAGPRVELSRRQSELLRTKLSP